MTAKDKANTTLLAVAICVTLTSCLDMITDKCDQVVGRIFLTSSNGDWAYRLSFADSNFSCDAGGSTQRIIDDEVQILQGNDSVIYVQAIDRTDTNYYVILHGAGKSILRKQKVGKIGFASI